MTDNGSDNIRQMCDIDEYNDQCQSCLLYTSSQNKTLKNILEAVYRMAARKRKANQERPEGETEPRFKLYEYPEFEFHTTERMSNLEVL